MIADQKKDKLVKKLAAKSGGNKAKAEKKAESGSGSSSDDDEELAQELEKDEEMKGVDDENNLDETVFDKFATGELDLPDEADEESSDDEAADAGADDSELEAYYEELGIDPAEMID